MSHQFVPNSPTGRQARSEPEMQFIPGTPQALAQARKLRAARDAAGTYHFRPFDLSNLEVRALSALVPKPVQAKV